MGDDERHVHTVATRSARNVDDRQAIRAQLFAGDVTMRSDAATVVRRLLAELRRQERGTDLVVLEIRRRTVGAAGGAAPTARRQRAAGDDDRRAPRLTRQREPATSHLARLQRVVVRVPAKLTRLACSMTTPSVCHLSPTCRSRTRRRARRVSRVDYRLAAGDARIEARTSSTMSCAKAAVISAVLEQVRLAPRDTRDRRAGRRRPSSRRASPSPAHGSSSERLGRVMLRSTSHAAIAFARRATSATTGRVAVQLHVVSGARATCASSEAEHARDRQQRVRLWLSPSGSSTRSRSSSGENADRFRGGGNDVAHERDEVMRAVIVRARTARTRTQRETRPASGSVAISVGSSFAVRCEVAEVWLHARVSDLQVARLEHEHDVEQRIASGSGRTRTGQPSSSWWSSLPASATSRASARKSANVPVSDTRCVDNMPTSCGSGCVPETERRRRHRRCRRCATGCEPAREQRTASIPARAIARTSLSRSARDSSRSGSPA